MTEPGVIHQMKKESPSKTFIPLPSNDGCACNECPHMRLNTIEKNGDSPGKYAPRNHASGKLASKGPDSNKKMLVLS